MSRSLSQLLLAAAAVCFVIALLATLGTVHGTNGQAWLDGGLLAFVLAHLTP